MNYHQISDYSKESDTAFIKILLKRLYFLYRSKNIIASSNVTIKNIDNIVTGGLLKIGIDYNGFNHKKDITLLNIRGKLTFLGSCSIEKGCRFDIGKKWNS
ncbi:MAG TPA: hypothetical protein PK296_02175 [Paludibacteraceae bacterium]|nr:hypothetical protein [Paludibacteraceae bacterium]